MTTFGFELEVSDNAGNVLSHLRRLGLTEHDGLHEYHCDCSACEPSTRGPLFKAQEDCTADGEFITRILEYGSDEADRAINGISRALLAGQACVTGDVGNHVHVSRDDLDYEGEWRLAHLFARYQTELQEIAAAGRSKVRGYNDPVSVFEPYTFWNVGPNNAHCLTPDHYASGSYLLWKQPTVEFRLWNSTRAAWRIRTHVGLSVAMVYAAIDGVDCVRHDPRCVEDAIGDYIDGPTWAGILRQRYSKGGLDVV